MPLFEKYKIRRNRNETEKSGSPCAGAGDGSAAHGNGLESRGSVKASDYSRKHIWRQPSGQRSFIRARRRICERNQSQRRQGSAVFCHGHLRRHGSGPRRNQLLSRLPRHHMQHDRNSRKRHHLRRRCFYCQLRQSSSGSFNGNRQTEDSVNRRDRRRHGCRPRSPHPGTDRNVQRQMPERRNHRGTADLVQTARLSFLRRLLFYGNGFHHADYGGGAGTDASGHRPDAGHLRRFEEGGL